MREIKFRAYGPNCKMMWGWEAVKRIANTVGWEHFNAGERILMQYTGLKDKNGVEIYEGDICHVDGLGNCEVGVCGLYGTVFKSNGYEHPVIDSIAENDSFEVIGNIYENPELLKGDL